MDGNLFNASEVSSAFESGLKVSAGHHHCHTERYETGRYDQNVGVVVLFDQSGYSAVPRKTGSDASAVVESDRHSIARAAYCYSAVQLSLLEGLGHRMGEVGIVTTLRTVRPEIHNLVAFF